MSWPAAGELHGLAYYWQWDHASYQVLGTDGKIGKRIDVPLNGKSTIHDMAFTPKYAVFLDGPIVFNAAAHAAGYEFPYMWDHGYRTRWAVVDRSGTAADVKFCDAPGACTFHILNAFDLPGGRVAVDAVTYPVLFVDDLTGPTDAKGRLDRFILDPATGTAKAERLDDRPQEMPRLDERLAGRTGTAISAPGSATAASLSRTWKRDGRSSTTTAPAGSASRRCSSRRRLTAPRTTAG